MKRRGFLGSLVALVCAPFVPKVVPAPRPMIEWHDQDWYMDPSPEYKAWIQREGMFKRGETIDFDLKRFAMK